MRKCSQSDSTALSVKLGYEHGFVVDHFIIRDRAGRVSLKSSSLEFDTLLSLVYHHMSQVDSLPVLLALPSILRNTDTRQCLTSLALLGRGQISNIILYPGEFPQSVCSLEIQNKIFLLNPSINMLDRENKQHVNALPVLCLLSPPFIEFSLMCCFKISGGIPCPTLADSHCSYRALTEPASWRRRRTAPAPPSVLQSPGRAVSLGWFTHFNDYNY